MPKKPHSKQYRPKSYFKDKKAAAAKAVAAQAAAGVAEVVLILNDANAVSEAHIVEVPPVLQASPHIQGDIPVNSLPLLEQAHVTASRYERVERLEIPGHDRTLIENLHVDHDYAHKLSTVNETPVHHNESLITVKPTGTVECEVPVILCDIDLSSVPQNEEIIQQNIILHSAEACIDFESRQCQSFPLTFQQIEMENAEPDTLSTLDQTSNASVPCVVDMDSVLAEIQRSLPTLWNACLVDGGFSITLSSADVAHVTQRSIHISSDGEVLIFVHGHVLRKDHEAYRKSKISKLTSITKENFVAEVVAFVKEIRLMEVCIGASNCKYKVWWKSSMDKCFIDNNLFKETRYTETLRSNNCDYLVHQPKKYCASCSAVLVRFANRKAPPSPTAKKKTPNKFKPFKHCSSAEKEARNKRKAKSVRNLQRKNTRLQLRLVSLINEEGVEIDDELSNPLGKEADEWLKKQRDKAQEEKSNDDKFFEIFVQQQLEARRVKGKGGIKWHPLMIRFALQLKMCSQAALTSARNFFKLPSDRLLWDYTHIYDVEPGCQLQFINEIAERVKEMKHDYQAFHVLSFDEVTVKENLVQRKSTGNVIGYCKLSEVQTEIIDLRKKLEDEAQSLKPQLVTAPPMAKKMLTFMIRGTASDVMSCVASYPVAELKKEHLHEYTWEVIGNLECGGIKVIAIVCDGSTVNRGFIQMQQPATETESGIVFDTCNPFDVNRPIFFIPDPPHALKTTRNCLENSGKKKSRHLMKNGEHLSWDPIVRLFKWKSTVKKCPKLTAACVFLNSYSRMCVCYACRVFSHTVASTIKMLNWPGTNELCIFRKIQ